MWYYHPLNRLRARLANRLLVVLVVAVFVVVCFVCPFVFGVTDLAMRQVGLLPTRTPRPPESPTRPPAWEVTATLEAGSATLRLRDLLEACQACGRFVLAELAAPEAATLQDCLDARVDLLPGDPARVLITMQIGTSARGAGRVPAAARCEVVHGDHEWRLDSLWFQSSGAWRPHQPGVDE